MLVSEISSNLAFDFGKWLSGSNYGFIYKSICGVLNSVEPWVEENNAKRIIGQLNNRDRKLTEFLLLGASQSKKDINGIFDSQSVKFLLDSGFAEESGDMINPAGYVILPVGELFLIVSLPSNYSNMKKKVSDIYIGSDSLKLMKFVKSEHYNRVLDLCAGSGVQGLNLAAHSDNVVAIELNDIAYASAILNAKINNINSEKYQIRKGNLYDVADGNFDCIISNPPFVPVPKSITFPLCGDGGEDGQDIAREIINGYDKFLLKDGKAYMVLECIGDEIGPYIINYMKDRLKSGVINVSLLNRQPIELQADASAQIAMSLSDKHENYETYFNDWMQIFKAYNAEFIYPVVIEYIKTGGALEINYLRNYNLWSLNSKFKILPNVTFKTENSDTYVACLNNKEKASFDEEVMNTLRTFEGVEIRKAIKSNTAQEKILQIRNLLYAMNLLEDKGIICRL